MTVASLDPNTALMVMGVLSNRLTNSARNAAVADLPGDSFTGPEHLMHMRGGAELIAKSRTAQNPALAQHLRTHSEELTGVHSTI